jgi:hypothetical protein
MTETLTVFQTKIGTHFYSDINDWGILSGDTEFRLPGILVSIVQVTKKRILVQNSRGYYAWVDKEDLE